MSMCRHCFAIVTCLLMITQTACIINPPRESPDIVLENGHSGGSIVRFNPSATLLATGNWSGQVRLVNPQNGFVLTRIRAHDGTVHGIEFVDDETLITAGLDGFVHYWQSNGKLISSLQTGSPVTAMDMSGTLLVTGHNDGLLRSWSLPEFKLLDEFNYHRGSVKAIAIDSSGNRFATASSNHEVFYVDEKRNIVELQNPPTNMWTLAFSPDDRFLLGGGWFRLTRWSIVTGKRITIPTEHHGIIKSLQYAPGSNYLVSISRQTDSAVNFIDPQTGATLRRFQKHELCGGDIDISDNGRYLATTSDDASVMIWDLLKQSDR